MIYLSSCTTVSTSWCSRAPRSLVRFAINARYALSSCVLKTLQNLALKYKVPNMFYFQLDLLLKPLMSLSPEVLNVPRIITDLQFCHVNFWHIDNIVLAQTRCIPKLILPSPKNNNLNFSPQKPLYVSLERWYSRSVFYGSNQIIKFCFSTLLT